MVKTIRQILSVPTRRMDSFDVSTVYLKRRMTWNLKYNIKLNSEEVWQF
jgi:hypothetical protein